MPKSHHHSLSWQKHNQAARWHNPDGLPMVAPPLNPYYSPNSQQEEFYVKHVRPTIRLKHAVLLLMLFMIGSLVVLHSPDNTLSSRWVGSTSASGSSQALYSQDIENRRKAWTKGKGKSWVNVSDSHESMYQSLLPNVRYATTLIAGGFSNQLVGSLEMLDYAQRSGRVGVLNDFTSYPLIHKTNPSHQPRDIMPLEMVFDLERYVELSGHPSLKLRDLKKSLTTPDELSCIATHSGILSLTDRPPVRAAEDKGMGAYQPPGVNVKVWPCPIETGNVQAISTAGLVEFSEGGWWEIYEQTVTSQNGGSEFGPLNRNFVCLADMYWVNEKQDIFSRWNPGWTGWTNVGKYLHYSTHLVNLKNRYVDLVLDGHASSDLPGHQRPFIAIHARHNDFPCTDPNSATCFRSATMYVEEVARIRKVLKEEQNVIIRDQDIIMFSDEVNESWWEEVTDVLGWRRVDHDVLGTLNSMDNWWPTLIDMAMMSSAKGFIGSRGSTYSLFASLRVQDWNGGLSSIV